MSSSDIFEAMHFLLYSIHMGALICAHILFLTANNHVLEKYRVPQNRPRRPRGEVEVELYSFFNLGARWWVVNATPRPRYPRERPGTHCIGSWVGSSVGLDGRKISPPPGFDPRNVKPVARRYTDWTNPPPLNFPRILGLKMLKWGFGIGKRIQKLVGELHVIYRISEYIKTMIEPFWTNESEVYYEELSSLKPEENGTL